MINVHESTLALSVYRAIQRCGSMTREQIAVHLRKHWEPGFDDADMAIAEKYLRSRGMVDGEGELRATRTDGGVAATVIRNPARETELIYGGAR